MDFPPDWLSESQAELVTTAISYLKSLPPQERAEILTALGSAYIQILIERKKETMEG